MLLNIREGSWLVRMESKYIAETGGMMATPSGVLGRHAKNTYLGRSIRQLHKFKTYAAYITLL